MKERLKKIFAPLNIGILGVILTIIGTIIPNIYLVNVPMSYIEGDGKIICLMMIFVLLCIWRKKAIISLIPTFVSCGIFTYYLYNTTPTKVMSQQLFEIATYGPGTYLMIIGLCLCLYYGVCGNNIGRPKEKIDFNIKYFLLGLILPLIGYFIWITKRYESKIKSHNCLNGAIIGTVCFLAFILILGLIG